MKYREFGFDAAEVLEISDEYPDKMIQLPLTLMPIDPAGHLGGLAMPDEPHPPSRRAGAGDEVRRGRHARRRRPR